MSIDRLSPCTFTLHSRPFRINDSIEPKDDDHDEIFSAVNNYHEGHHASTAKVEAS